MVQCERLSEPDRARNSVLYTTYLDAGMEDGWTKEDKVSNFEALAKIEQFTGQPLSGTSVLDVGCGTGDLSAFLRQKGIAKYRGVDVHPNAIYFAKMKYPKERFVLADFLTAQFGEKYHYAFLSGTLATQFATDNYEVMKAMVNKMWNLTTNGAALNFLTDQSVYPAHQTSLFFYNLERALAICSEIASGGKVIHETGYTGINKDIVQSTVYLIKPNNTSLEKSSTVSSTIAHPGIRT